jgi:ketosteroid isomerase-like protein
VLVRARHTEIVRRAFDLFEAGEIEALVALYHPRIEIHVTGALGPPAQAYSGLDSARGYLQSVVDQGMNCKVEDLELLEFGDRVVVRGRMVTPVDLAMRWHFDFQGDLIARVVPLEGNWAVLDDREFTLGQVAETPRSGTVTLRLSDGRSLAAPIAADLESCARVTEPVMAYFDEGRLTGWYLPDLQRGMDLR